MKNFNRNKVDKIRLGGMESIKQQNIYPNKCQYSNTGIGYRYRNIRSDVGALTRRNDDVSHTWHSW